MIIENFNIKLRRIQESDLELIRSWRNSTFVRQHMEFREEITPEMQLQWFHKINNENNLYLFIESQNEKVGLINLKGINFKRKSTEIGIYMADEKYVSTRLPLLALMTIAEAGLHFFGLEKLHAHVLKSNNRSIHLTKTCGFKLCKKQENVENQRYEVTKSDIEIKFIPIIKALRKIYGEDRFSRILFEPHDFTSGYAVRMIRRLNPDIQIYRSFDKDGVCFSGISPYTNSRIKVDSVI
ncbi:MAG: GNAT family N-acetyltransferase [Bacteroidales bacterium]